MIFEKIGKPSGFVPFGEGGSLILRQGNCKKDKFWLWFNPLVLKHFVCSSQFQPCPPHPVHPSPPPTQPRPRNPLPPSPPPHRPYGRRGLPAEGNLEREVPQKIHPQDPCGGGRGAEGGGCRRGGESARHQVAGRKGSPRIASPRGRLSTHGSYDEELLC